MLHSALHSLGVALVGTRHQPQLHYQYHHQTAPAIICYQTATEYRSTSAKLRMMKTWQRSLRPLTEPTSVHWALRYVCKTEAVHCTHEMRRHTT